MNEDTRLVTVPPAAMPALTIEQALARRDQQRAFITQVLIKDQDYGEIPGTKKDTLFKPGAEKLLMFFGLHPRFEAIQTVEDWTGKDFNGEPFFYYHQKCILYRDGETMAEADGSCNSRESKFRYRKGERLCPKCQLPNVRKGKDSGWYCWTKTGGCGSTFKDGDPAIEKQETGRILNVDVADQANTILKQSQKRALVAVTLIAVNASEYFTQDIEDLPPQGESIEGEVRVIHEDTKAAKPPPMKVASRIANPIEAATEIPYSSSPTEKPVPLNDWIAVKESRKAFWAAAKAMGYTEISAHAALNVTSMRFYVGSLREAIDTLQEEFEHPVDAVPSTGEDIDREVQP